MRPLFALPWILAASFIAGAGSAETVVQTVAWGGTGTEWRSDGDGYCNVGTGGSACYQDHVNVSGAPPSSFTVSGFDSSIGQLEAVEVAFSATFAWSNEFTWHESPWGTYENADGRTTPFYEGSHSYYVGDTWTHLVGDRQSVYNASCDAAPNGQPCTIEFDLPLSATATVADPTPFVTTDPVPLFWEAETYFGYDYFSDPNYYPAPAFETTFTLTYHYVPEPGPGS